MHSNISLVLLLVWMWKVNNFVKISTVFGEFWIFNWCTLFHIFLYILDVFEETESWNTTAEAQKLVNFQYNRDRLQREIAQIIVELYNKIFGTKYKINGVFINER